MGFYDTFVFSNPLIEYRYTQFKGVPDGRYILELRHEKKLISAALNYNFLSNDTLNLTLIAHFACKFNLKNKKNLFFKKKISSFPKIQKIRVTGVGYCLKGVP